MNCESCNQPFNLTSKIPLVLYCCGGTTCKECIINLCGGPQQRLFTCPQKDCQETNQDQNTLKPNKHLVKVLKSTIGILCDQHPQNYGEFYCKQDNQFICAACIVSTHMGHRCQSFDRQDIINYNNKIVEYLKKEQSRIQKIINDIEQYQSNDIKMTSLRYLELIKEAQNTVNQSLNSEDKDSLQFPPIKNEEEKQEPNQIEQNKIEVFKIDSKLIKQEDYLLLKEYFKTDKLTLELIYRGTDNGFTAKAFHERCDKRGPTLTVALSEHDQLIGGYTSISWEINEIGQYYCDSQAFLIQLTKKNKLTQFQNINKAILTKSSCGPVFGNGNDLGFLRTEKDNLSWSAIYNTEKCTFRLPPDIKTNKEEALKYFGGSPWFNLKEIEVFKVII